MITPLIQKIADTVKNASGAEQLSQVLTGSMEFEVQRENFPKARYEGKVAECQTSVTRLHTQIRNSSTNLTLSWCVTFHLDVCVRHIAKYPTYPPKTDETVKKVEPSALKPRAELTYKRMCVRLIFRTGSYIFFTEGEISYISYTCVKSQYYPNFGRL